MRYLVFGKKIFKGVYNIQSCQSYWLCKHSHLNFHWKFTTVSSVPLEDKTEDVGYKGPISKIKEQL